MEFIRLTFLLFLFTTPLAQTAHADKLIAKNWLSSGEDWYLIEDSVKWTGDREVYGAVSYLKLHKPQDYLEVFDGDFNVIGKNIIGNYRSYAYFSIFDCNKNLEATYSIMYFSTDRPAKGRQIYEEMVDNNFLMPMEQKLMDQVCEIGNSKR